MILIICDYRDTNRSQVTTVDESYKMFHSCSQQRSVFRRSRGRNSSLKASLEKNKHVSPSKCISFIDSASTTPHLKKLRDLSSSKLEALEKSCDNAENVKIKSNLLNK